MSTLTVKPVSFKMTLQNNATSVVSFPEGARKSEWGGQNDESPTVVVHNVTDLNNGETPDGTWQGCDNNGGLVIINEMTEVAASQALDLYESQGIAAAYDYLADIGFRDQYTTSEDWFDENLTPAGRMVGVYSGYVKRIETSDMEIGRKSDGQVYLLSHESQPRIEEDILLRTYVMPDGSQIDASSIPTVE